MATEYEIARTTGRCAATDRILEEGEPYFTALFEMEDHLERRDFSVEAWDGPPEGCFCFWKTRIPVRDQKRQPLVINQELLTQIFLQLEETESEPRQRFRFILALLLMRKRVLKLEKTEREDGAEFWELRLVKDQSTHRLRNPELTSAQVEQLSVQMTQLLTGEPDAIDRLEQQGDTPSEGEAEATRESADAAGEPEADSEATETPPQTSHDEETEATRAES